MIHFLTKLFFSVVPKQCLLPLHKVKNGERVFLTEKETRERHAESVANRIKQRLEQANIIKRTISSIKEKRVRQRHYMLIGELCVAFSVLEQTIKRELRNFDADPKHDTKSGDALINAFTKALKNSPIDEDTKKSFYNFLENYRQIARERNQALKCSYSYSSNDGTIKKINHRFPENLRDHKGTWEEYIKSSFQRFDEDLHKKLIEKTNSLCGELLKIQYEIMKKYSFWDGKIYPSAHNAKVGDIIYPL